MGPGESIIFVRGRGADQLGVGLFRVEAAALDLVACDDGCSCHVVLVEPLCIAAVWIARRPWIAGREGVRCNGGADPLPSVSLCRAADRSRLCFVISLLLCLEDLSVCLSAGDDRVGHGQVAFEGFPVWVAVLDEDDVLSGVEALALELACQGVNISFHVTFVQAAVPAELGADAPRVAGRVREGSGRQWRGLATVLVALSDVSGDGLLLRICASARGGDDGEDGELGVLDHVDRLFLCLYVYV